MGFNRLVDARLDALEPTDRQPRAAARRDEHARGRLFVVVASVVFMGAAWRLNPLCLAAVAGGAGDRVLVLARQALYDVDAAVPGTGHGGRAGRRLAGRGRPRRVGAVAAGDCDRHAGSAVSTFCTRARISTFDRAHGLRSIPVRFGVPALAVHLARHARRRGAVPARAVVGRAASALLLVGVGIVAVLLAYEQSLVRADDLSQVKRAFDMNGYVGILYLLVLAASIYGG